MTPALRVEGVPDVVPSSTRQAADRVLAPLHGHAHDARAGSRDGVLRQLRRVASGRLAGPLALPQAVRALRTRRARGPAPRVALRPAGGPSCHDAAAAGVL